MPFHASNTPVNRVRSRGRKPQPAPKPKRRKVRPTRKTEPALYRGAVVSVLSLLAALGVSWAADVDKETIEAIVVVVAVVVPMAQALWTRYAVTPAEPE